LVGEVVEWSEEEGDESPRKRKLEEAEERTEAGKMEGVLH
jgi:hypothetical protein